MSLTATQGLLTLDSLLTDRVRLAIVVTLAGSEDSMDFKSLLEQLELSKGNLSSHMRKLEEAELVTIQKEFIERKPRTTYLLSEKGSIELKQYLEAIEAFLQSTSDL